MHSGSEDKEKNLKKKRTLMDSPDFRLHGLRLLLLRCRLNRTAGKHDAAA
jgi:hypothetical protein